MSEPIRIALVAAMAENRTIGKDGVMPWSMRSDLKWFKATTLGKPVVMGRKTFESIGKPLPQRTNIVITRQADFEREGALTAQSLEQALRIAEMDARENDRDEICVIGGGEIYATALPLATRLYLTLIEAGIDGDTHFPEVHRKDWQITEQGQIDQSKTDDFSARIEVWDRSLDDVPAAGD